MERHNDNAKEWGTLGSQDLLPSAITYKPRINRRTVQGKRTWYGSQQDGGTANGGAVILVRRSGQVEVPA